MYATKMMSAMLASLILSGCAYTTAVPVTAENTDTIRGFRVFAPKTFLVATGSAVSTVVVPDCSREFAVQFGTFLAKNEVTVKMTNSILTEVSAKEDSTALPLEFLKSITETAKAGKELGQGLSEKAEGGTDRFAVWSVDCRGDSLALNPVVQGAIAPGAAPPAIPPAIGGGGGAPIMGGPPKAR